MSTFLPVDDPVAVAATQAIRSGDLDALHGLLTAHPALVTARIGTADDARSLLHVLADWPGHRPGAAATAAALVRAGVDVNVRFVGAHAETPLHWAASNDDVPLLDALLDAGADVDADGGVIGGGTPLLDATAFRQWHTARRLVQRGARVGLWEAAALGLLDRVAAALDGGAPAPTPQRVTEAFWGACHGGQRGTAEFLLDRGADLDWVGWDGLTPLDAARRAGADAVAAWLLGRGARSASSG